MTRFFVQNFGCRATQADGAALEAQLAERGLAMSADRESADLVVLNTCTVTAEADSDARSTIRRVHRENPAARILVTGCYAQRAPDELAKMPGVEWVVGNSHKTQIAEVLAGEVDYHGQIVIGDIMETRDILTAPVLDAGGDRTRPNLKIQDGCHNRCSFCIIPFVRGRSRSLPADRVVEQMSSGEAQRILIARALVHQPQTLVFDEPTNSLDLLMQRELRETMRRLAQSGVGIVLVTHQTADIIPEIERVVLMREGRIVGDGRKEEMLTEEKMSALFGFPARINRRDGYCHVW